MKLAALHFNENVKRKVATTSTGEKRYKMTFPKFKKGEATVREIKQAATFRYVTSLIEEVMKSSESGQIEKLSQAPPPLTSAIIKPNKSDAVRSMLTRFKKD